MRYERLERTRESRIGPSTRRIADRCNGIYDATSPRPGYGQFVFIADPGGLIILSPTGTDQQRLDSSSLANLQVQQVLRYNV